MTATKKPKPLTAAQIEQLTLIATRGGATLASTATLTILRDRGLITMIGCDIWGWAVCDATPEGIEAVRPHLSPADAALLDERLATKAKAKAAQGAADADLREWTARYRLARSPSTPAWAAGAAKDPIESLRRERQRVREARGGIAYAAGVHHGALRAAVIADGHPAPPEYFTDLADAICAGDPGALAWVRVVLGGAK